MPKQKISAKELIADIRAGIDDSALMKKYGLSEQALQSALNRLVEAKALRQIDLDNRAHLAERTVGVIWKCPACGMPQTEELSECPVCGVIVSKYKNVSVKSTSAGESLPQDGVENAPSFFKAHRGEMILAFCGIVLLGIVGAGFWVKAEAERKRQVEAARIERIEKEQRLQAEAESRAKEAELRAQETKRQMEAQKEETKQRVEAERETREWEQRVKAEARMEDERLKNEELRRQREEQAAKEAAAEQEVQDDAKNRREAKVRSLKEELIEMKLNYARNLERTFPTCWGRDAADSRCRDARESVEKSRREAEQLKRELD